MAPYQQSSGKWTRTRTWLGYLSFEAELPMQVELGLEIRSELGLVFEFRPGAGFERLFALSALI